MQCRQFSIMTDLKDESYKVKPLDNTQGRYIRVSPLIRKRYFINQNALIVFKEIRCSHIESSSMQNEAFS